MVFFLENRQYSLCKPAPGSNISWSKQHFLWDITIPREFPPLHYNCYHSWDKGLTKDVSKVGKCRCMLAYNLYQSQLLCISCGSVDALSYHIYVYEKYLNVQHYCPIWVHQCKRFSWWSDVVQIKQRYFGMGQHSFKNFYFCLSQMPECIPSYILLYNNITNVGMTPKAAFCTMHVLCEMYSEKQSFLYTYTGKVKPVLRDCLPCETTCFARPHNTFLEGPTFGCNWTCHIRPPVWRLHVYGEWGGLSRKVFL